MGRRVKRKTLGERWGFCRLMDSNNFIRIGDRKIE